ncbi:Type 4 prepilin-like proteins leader peptide-processing enzyme [Paenibacillus solanacearum]|uniref:Type 4 prepilin-like proteins leader peptide-processing enzyme n=1 Tax=Paenibacillus solanacearum TaxID=2048548 RepID=A0A916K8D1_9BACL|nr:A24 family peptidase [Paenibacillus solanacearum]CAG7649649.1 Type 4 prepilin-like proteins leader peptide-processing enzyme [Paenibacillus solanacearum]
MGDYWLYFPFVVVLGLLIGSFMNVVAIRILKQESVVFPPSHCVHCNHSLKPLDLIPLLSYLFLRGKCRYCRAAISWVYPAGEAATAALFALLYWQLGLSPELLTGFLLAAILTAIVITDLKSMLIPDTIVLAGMIFAVILRLWTHPLPLWDYAIAFFAGSGLLWIIAIASKGGMGGGDIKLFAFLGLVLGIKLTLLTLFVASLMGTLYGLVLFAMHRLQKKHTVPFGPFIATAAMLMYLWGDSLIEWYMEMIMG